MPDYRVFRLKENLRQQFRWAPHLTGVATVKPRDYFESFTIDAESPYAVWHSVRGTERELEVGDVLQNDTEGLRILKYIGFEEAQWAVPEPKSSALEQAPDGVNATGQQPQVQ